PYLFRGDRPVIGHAPSTASTGEVVPIKVAGSADSIDDVVLMRRTAITHLVDGGQRSVELPIVARRGDTVYVRMPTDPSVVPAGPYLLFVNRATKDGRVPSVAADVSVPVAPPVTAPVAPVRAVSRPATTVPAPDLAKAGAVRIDARLAYHEIA